MTNESTMRAAVISDIDRTIVHWVKIGVRAADIGMELKCRHKWADIRRKMIVIAMPPREKQTEATMVALIGCRKRLRLTVEHVANRLGISRHTLGIYENGRRTPPTEILAAWRSAVGLRVKPERLAREEANTQDGLARLGVKAHEVSRRKGWS